MEEIEELGYTLDEIRKMHKGTDDFDDFCYQIVKLCGDNQSKLEEIAHLIKYKAEDMKKKAESYKDEEKYNYQDTEKAHQKREMYIKQGYYKKLDSFITELLKINEEEIIDFFNQSENRLLLKDSRGMSNYLMNMYPYDYKEKMLIIRKKIELYREYLLNIKKQSWIQKYDDEALRIYNEVLKNSSIKSFRELFVVYPMHKNKSKEIIDYWKTNYNNEGKTLYEKMAEKLNENRYKYFSQNYFEDIEKLLALTNIPIKVGDKKRNLDELDCFTYFRCPFGKLFQIVSEYFVYDNIPENKEKINQVTILKNILIPQYKAYNFAPEFPDVDVFKKIPISLEKIAVDNILQKDIYSPIIGKLLTDEDKKEIINEMKMNDIPISMNTFMLLVSRYYNHHLELITKDTIDSYIEKGKKK